MDTLNLSSVITELAARDERIADMCCRLVLIVHGYRAVHRECFCECAPETAEAWQRWVCQRCEQVVRYSEMVFPPTDEEQYAHDVVYLLTALSETTDLIGALTARAPDA